jgi:hypothetical protein
VSFPYKQSAELVQWTLYINLYSHDASLNQGDIAVFVHLSVLTGENQGERNVAQVCGNGFGLANSMFMYFTATAIAEPHLSQRA